MNTRCSLDVALLLDPITTVNHKRVPQRTADGAQRLFYKHQLTLRLTVAAAGSGPPAPEVLALLGPDFYQFDTWHIPTQQPADGGPANFDMKTVLTSQHVRVLAGGKASVVSICVTGSLDAIGNNPSNYLEEISVPVIGVIAALDSMTNLTTLQLTKTDWAIDYQPLAQLSSLKHLALQCSVDKPCCEGVLDSNRHTLTDVTLTAPTWSVATLCSLQRNEQLDTLNISVLLTLPRHKRLATSQQTASGLCFIACSTVMCLQPSVTVGQLWMH